MNRHPLHSEVRIGHVHLKVADLERSLGFYLRDPDGSGVELYWDKPKEQWPHTADGGLAMYTHPLDLDALLREGVSD